MYRTCFCYYYQFGRWSLLLLGVSYGATRHSYLQKKEDKTREARYQLKAEREAKMAAEKKKFAEGNLKFKILLIFIKYQVFNIFVLF